MQFKSFMEALKGKQHKIDKNKNGEIDAHDFKLLRKEESEETIEESEERQARADYKTSPSGRKSHKEIVFGDAESKDDDKKDMKEELLDEGQTEDWKNIQSMDKGSVTGDKSSIKTRLGYLNAVHAHHKKYGNDTMKVRKEIESINKSRIAEAEELDEALDPSEVAGNPKMYDAATVKKAYYHKSTSTIDKESLARHLDRHHGNKEWRTMKEELDEKSEQAKRNKTMKNMMDASRGARFKYSNSPSMTPKPDTGHKTPRDHNVAIGRALRALRNEDLDEKITVATGGANKVKKDEKTGVVSGTFDKSPPFDGPYTKTKPTKNSDGSVQTPMSRARELAKQAMKQKMKEEFDIDMSDEQAESILECISEQAPVAPTLDRKYIRGTPEHKAYKATKKPINGHPTNVKEDLDEVEHKTLSYNDFVANLLEYESKDGVYRNKGTYGGNYVDPEGADDADDKKPKQQSAEKRGRGRPSGAKSGARKITGTSKLFK